MRVHYCFTLTGRFMRALLPILTESGATLHQPLRAVQPFGCYEIVISCILRVFKPYPTPFRKGSYKQQGDKTPHVTLKSIRAKSKFYLENMHQLRYKKGKHNKSLLIE
ncbi:hypothetical protein DRN38_07685 [Thermococci archaeon]|nr:MAG: hypothetical protein DRN38_07685 [Thermococci archaeon]